MRSRTVAAMSAGIAVLTCAAVFAPGASAHPAPKGAHNSVTAVPAASTRLGGTSSAPAKGRHICFRNMNLKFSTGANIPADTYDQGDSPYNSMAADDFTLTSKCVVKEVDVAGSFNQTSNVDWQNVYLYRDVNGAPAPFAFWAQTAINGTQGRQAGDYDIPFGPVTLSPGTYWISVQMQLASGQWGWDNTSKAAGNPALFMNPGGGFPGCETWTPIQTCFPSTPGPDLMFALKS